MSDSKPPIEYLLCCSDSSLQGFELSRLNSVSNLRKQLVEVLNELAEAEAEARLARWLDARRSLQRLPAPDAPAQPALPFPETGALKSQEQPRANRLHSALAPRRKA